MLRKEFFKKKQLSLRNFGLPAWAEPRAQAHTPGTQPPPPQTHLLLPETPPSITGEGPHWEEGAVVAGCWPGLPLPVLCFRIPRTL